MSKYGQVAAAVLNLVVLLIIFFCVNSKDTEEPSSEFTFTNTFTDHSQKHSPGDMYMVMLKNTEEPEKEIYPTETPTQAYLPERKTDPTPAPITHDYINNASESYFLYQNTPVPGALWDTEGIYYTGVSHSSIISTQPVSSYNFGEIEEAALTFKGTVQVDRMYFTDEGTVIKVRKLK